MEIESINNNNNYNYNNEKIIIKNNYFYFSKQNINDYLIKCIIQQKNIILENLFNFNLLQIMYQSNNDLFDIIDLKIIDSRYSS